MAVDVQAHLKKIAEAKAAQLQAAATGNMTATPPPATAPPAQPDVITRLEKPAEQITAEARAEANQLQKVALVKPADMPQEVWDQTPQDVKRLICLGPGGQAVPVNPPEATAGLAASAEASVTGEDPAAIVARNAGAAAPEAKRGRGRPAGSKNAPAVETPVPPAVTSTVVNNPPIDLAPIVTELSKIRVALETIALAATTTANRDLEKSLDGLTTAVLGAAETLAG